MLLLKAERQIEQLIVNDAWWHPLHSFLSLKTPFLKVANPPQITFSDGIGMDLESSSSAFSSVRRETKEKQRAQVLKSTIGKKRVCI